MKTFDELRSILSRDLAELRKLEESRFTTIEERHVKEQDIGRLCYEAEEDLDILELNVLKRTVGISEIQWRAYKAKFIEGSSPGELT
jgi:hypothetical protein